MVCECEICEEICREMGSGWGPQVLVDDGHQSRLRGFLIPVDERKYEQQLQVKVERRKSEWIQRAGEGVEFALTRSPPLHHRLRAKFFFGRNGPEDAFRFGLNYKIDGVNVVDFNVEQFPVATKRINCCMKSLLRLANENKDATWVNDLHVVNFLDTMGEADFLVCLYYKGLFEPETWKADIQANVLAGLQRDLSSQGRVTVMGKIRKCSAVVSSDPEHKDPSIRETGLFRGRMIQQYEGSFSNPNGMVTQRVNAWMEQTLQNHGVKDAYFIELCSGCGNHTVGLSRFFNKALSVEIDRNLTKQQELNLKLNDISNVTVVTNDIKNITKIMRRFLHRPQEDDEKMYVVLIDPPRGGLSDDLAKTIAEIPCSYLIYVACGEGLDKNFSTLSKSFTLQTVCFADHFPYTHFIEQIAFFKKKAELA